MEWEELGICHRMWAFLPGLPGRTVAHHLASNGSLSRSRVLCGSTYPEDVILRGSRHSLLHGLVQLLLSRQVSRDGPADLRANVVQRAQASLEAEARVRAWPSSAQWSTRRMHHAMGLKKACLHVLTTDVLLCICPGWENLLSYPRKMEAWGEGPSGTFS